MGKLFPEVERFLQSSDICQNLRRVAEAKGIGSGMDSGMYIPRRISDQYGGITPIFPRDSLTYLKLAMALE